MTLYFNLGLLQTILGKLFINRRPASHHPMPLILLKAPECGTFIRIIVPSLSNASSEEAFE